MDQPNRLPLRTVFQRLGSTSRVPQVGTNSTTTCVLHVMFFFFHQSLSNLSFSFPSAHQVHPKWTPPPRLIDPVVGPKGPPKDLGPPPLHLHPIVVTAMSYRPFATATMLSC